MPASRPKKERSEEKESSSHFFGKEKGKNQEENDLKPTKKGSILQIKVGGERGKGEGEKGLQSNSDSTWGKVSEGVRRGPEKGNKIRTGTKKVLLQPTT